MAGTITVTATLLDQVTGGQTENQGTSQAQFTQTGQNTVSETMGTSSTPAQIPIGSIGTLGYLYVKNLDVTNSISLRIGSGGSNFATLAPGQVGVFPTAGTAPYAVASSGNPVLQYLACEL